jgi:hypothetical protein
MALTLPDNLKGLVGKIINKDNENEYEIINYCNSGKRGHVFRAKNKYGIDRALKFIPKNKLRPGWEQEALKAHQLERQPNTVRFHTLFFHEDYFVMVFDFVEGKNLDERIRSHELTVGDIQRVLEDLLFFVRDCLSLSEPLRHGDLHPGNIILCEPKMGGPRGYEVMITDFGIGNTGAVLQPKDDRMQIGDIATLMLQSITREDLVQGDRVVYDVLCHGAALKKLREHSPLEKNGIEDILEELTRIKSSPSTGEAATRHTRFGDYLVGEQLGSRWTEWKELFVSGFPGYDDIVSCNTTVLTGTRGCGKTMVFRRLSALLTYEVGPVDDMAAGSLVGIYLNMNDIADAFLYDRQKPPEDNFAKRVIQFLHLSLLSEIIQVANVAREKAAEEEKAIYDKANKWLFDVIIEQLNAKQLYPGPVLEMRVAASVVENVRDRIRCSRTPDKKLMIFAQNDWLKRFVPELQKRMPWVGDKPIYFFLDDYSLPRVSSALQKVLNSVVFQRSDCFFFKISTESPSTLYRKDYSDKDLDCPHDYELTDLGSVTIHLPDEDRERFLDDVFLRRLARDKRFEKRTLSEVLGKFDISWVELAKKIRANDNVLYYGREVFVNMWSGDTRSMVKIAQNLLERLPTTKEPELPIDKTEQNKVFRNNGGEFLHQLKACTRTNRKSDQKSWGEHLVKIAETFKEMCLYELRNRDGGREGRFEPKQAFRIELVDECSLDGIEKEIYDDLIRYGVFLRDDRGKSIRGAIIPRLYLRRLLIPFCTLTFSKIDNISLNASAFNYLLKDPRDFFENWKKNRMQYETKQGEFFEK